MDRKNAIIVLFSIVLIAAFALVISFLSQLSYLTTVGLLFPLSAFAAGLYGLLSSDATTIDEVEEKILASSPNDWNYRENDQLYTYTEDVNLQIEEDSYENLDEFHEPWVGNYPDSTAYRYSVTVRYGSSDIKEITFVSVDGHNGTVPMPDPVDHTITEFEYHLGSILCSAARPEQYDRYLEIGGIEFE